MWTRWYEQISIKEKHFNIANNEMHAEILLKYDPFAFAFAFVIKVTLEQKTFWNVALINKRNLCVLHKQFTAR